MSEQIINVPIEALLKYILLVKHEYPLYVESAHANIILQMTGELPSEPLPDKFVYQTIWGFGELKPEDVEKMSYDELAKRLSLLETEDQDALVRLIPKREHDFWNFIEIGEKQWRHYPSS